MSVFGEDPNTFRGVEADKALISFTNARQHGAARQANHVAPAAGEWAYEAWEPSSLRLV